MGKLVEVKRYFCPCCEKIFITQRHKNCKFNPELKGCFTCRYTVCINEKIVKDEEFGETTEKTIRCDFGTGREISMLELSQAKWRQNCPDWEMIPSYESKSDFLSYIRHVNTKFSSVNNEGVNSTDEDEESSN